MPTACHRPLGRRMLASDKQPSASSPSRGSWRGSHGEAGAFKRLSVPGVALTRPSFLGKEKPGGVGRSGQLLGGVRIEDLPQPHRRRGGIAGWEPAWGVWPPLVDLPGGHREWSEVQDSESCATCMGEQSFPTQPCTDVLLIMIMTLQ